MKIWTFDNPLNTIQYIIQTETLPKVICTIIIGIDWNPSKILKKQNYCFEKKYFIEIHWQLGGAFTHAIFCWMPFF